MIKWYLCQTWHIFIKPLENLRWKTCRKPIAITNWCMALYFYLSRHCSESYGMYEVSKLVSSLPHLHVHTRDLQQWATCSLFKVRRNVRILQQFMLQRCSNQSYSELLSVHGRGDTSLGSKSNVALCRTLCPQARKTMVDAWWVPSCPTPCVLWSLLR